MENGINLMTLIGTLICFLISIVAYFVKQLHADFRKLTNDISEVKTITTIFKTEFTSGYEIINQKVEYLSKRIKKKKKLIFKGHEE